MVTGYTAPVADGTITTLKEFALRTAKEFLHHERDRGLDRPIIHAQVDPYYEQSLDDNIHSLEVWESLDADARENLRLENFQKSLAEFNERTKGNLVVRSRYEAMLAKVNAWVPPTKEHEDGIKRYMLEQLNESVKWDCGDLDGELIQLSAFPDFDQWCKEREDFLKQRVERSRTNLQQERERVAATNKWIDDLVNSLGDE